MESPESPSMESPESPSMESPESPSMESPESPPPELPDLLESPSIRCPGADVEGVIETHEKPKLDHQNLNDSQPLGYAKFDDTTDLDTEALLSCNDLKIDLTDDQDPLAGVEVSPELEMNFKGNPDNDLDFIPTFNCLYCEFTTSVEHAYHNHLKTHLPGSKPYTRLYCPECDYTTGTKKFLVFHRYKTHKIFTPGEVKVGIPQGDELGGCRGHGKGMALTWKDLTVSMECRNEKFFSLVNRSYLKRIVENGNAVIDGDVRLNGRRVDDSIRKVTGYMYQEDYFISILTVREHLRFMSRLKMDRRTSRRDREHRIETLMNVLSLSPLADSRIGGYAADGQKVRSLDSFTANRLVSVMKSLVQSTGASMIATIHQPSPEILAMFDAIYLVAEGRLVFSGTADDAVQFLLGSLPWATAWLKYTSWFMYTYESISVVQWQGVENIVYQYRNQLNIAFSTCQDKRKKLSKTVFNKSRRFGLATASRTKYKSTADLLSGNVQDSLTNTTTPTFLRKEMISSKRKKHFILSFFRYCNSRAIPSRFIFCIWPAPKFSNLGKLYVRVRVYL
ncbi:unnamed protein product [Nesidiocoris tenuis]|uniref:C2H2-type domain-containing protein n=1 Tax=Nesidiocoris tenuis TaxID=355587 RepID=A0A6H5GUS2_9HEMI|nr:unnamed protein product [Nesidiocoris tenuis]